jgi:uncharacterized protein YcaQ
MLELSLREARRLMIGAQLLAGPTPKRPTKQLMLDTIRHLGAVQIDSISVVARSHHIVLWSRLGNHPPEWLDELLGQDRAIFEYWAHAAAFVPIELYPYFRRAMLSYMDSGGNRWSEWAHQWIRENQHVFDHVVEHITHNGPVSSSSFDAPEGTKRAEAWAWYGNKPTNRALDFLWTMGVLMIHRREKFQRWYDLRERVHPTWTDDALPSLEEERLTLASISVQAMGVTTARWLSDYFRTNWGAKAIPGYDAKGVLERLVEQGQAVHARVAGISDPAYVSVPLLERRIPMSRTTLLSPFDSLIWDRRRTEAMFDFPLRLEAYTPAEKRQYGYFSLPILYRDRLVGRLDPKADRKARVLIVKALHLEPWFVSKDDERFYAALHAALESFRDFNDCDEIVVERGDPPEAAGRLSSVSLNA